MKAVTTGNTNDSITSNVDCPLTDSAPLGFSRKKKYFRHFGVMSDMRLLRFGFQTPYVSEDKTQKFRFLTFTVHVYKYI